MSFINLLGWCLLKLSYLYNSLPYEVVERGGSYHFALMKSLSKENLIWTALICILTLPILWFWTGSELCGSGEFLVLFSRVKVVPTISHYRRDLMELEPLDQNLNYDFDFQQFTHLRTPRVVKPVSGCGDENHYMSNQFYIFICTETF